MASVIPVVPPGGDDWPTGPIPVVPLELTEETARQMVRDRVAQMTPAELNGAARTITDAAGTDTWAELERHADAAGMSVGDLLAGAAQEGCSAAEYARIMAAHNGQRYEPEAAAAAAQLEADPAAELEAQRVAAAAHPDRPYLVHSGNYALYRTPAGEFHLTYQRTAATDPDTGEVWPVDGAPDIHMRDLPERAAMIVSMVMDRETPLPPMLENLIFGGAKPNLKAMLAMAKDMAGDENIAAMFGGPDGS